MHADLGLLPGHIMHADLGLLQQAIVDGAHIIRLHLWSSQAAASIVIRHLWSNLQSHVALVIFPEDLISEIAAITLIQQVRTLQPTRTL